MRCEVCAPWLLDRRLLRTRYNVIARGEEVLELGQEVALEVEAVAYNDKLPPGATHACDG